MLDARGGNGWIAPEAGPRPLTRPRRDGSKTDCGRATLGVGYGGAGAGAMKEEVAWDGGDKAESAIRPSWGRYQEDLVLEHARHAR